MVLNEVAKQCPIVLFGVHVVEEMLGFRAGLLSRCACCAQCIYDLHVANPVCPKYGKCEIRCDSRSSINHHMTYRIPMYVVKDPFRMCDLTQGVTLGLPLRAFLST